MGLRAEGLSYAYRKGTRPVLGGVDMEITAGVTALIGPNGAGKSTLLRLLAGVAPRGYRQGKVTLDGRDLLEFSAVERVKRIAMLAQVPQVSAPLTVREVVSLGRTLLARDGALVERAMEEVGLLGRGDELFGTLSIGERQLASFARVLAQFGFGESPSPRYLLADEPIAALDPKHELVIASQIRRLKERGVWSVVIVHDLGFAEAIADRIVGLGPRGQVQANGSTGDVLRSEVLEELFGCRFTQRHGSFRPELVDFTS